MSPIAKLKSKVLYLTAILDAGYDALRRRPRY